MMKKTEARMDLQDLPSEFAATDAAREVEVIAMAKRRQFSASEKRRLLAEADRCTLPGELGALLRREGIYSSNLATWRPGDLAPSADGSRTGSTGPKKARAQA